MSNPAEYPTSAEEERQLLLRHRDGDREAFTELVNGYRAPVFSYLFRCGVHPDDRDDLFQEIFIRIHRSASQYSAERPLHPWIFTIVANAVRTHQRKRRVRELLFAGSTEREPSDAAVNGESIAVAKQLRGWLEREIARLPFAQRQVLILSRIENLSQREVAAALSLPVNTVKTHLRRARLALVKRWRRQTSASGIREVSS